MKKYLVRYAIASESGEQTSSEMVDELSVHKAIIKFMEDMHSKSLHEKMYTVYDVVDITGIEQSYISQLETMLDNRKK